MKKNQVRFRHVGSDHSLVSYIRITRSLGSFKREKGFGREKLEEGKVQY
jgi:hypothetical protein